jgi:hypothetical protein
VKPSVTTVLNAKAPTNARVIGASMVFAVRKNAMGSVSRATSRVRSEVAFRSLTTAPKAAAAASINEPCSKTASRFKIAGHFAVKLKAP